MNYYLLHTTYLILFVSVFARQLCLPVPAMLFLLSAGALAGGGKLSFAGTMEVAVLGCLFGDLIWFEAGRLRGVRVLRLLCAFAPDPGYYIRQSKAAFARRGLPVLLIAKFVPGLDGIMPPLAGMSGAPRANFLLYDAGGSALWAGAYIGAGFLFAEQLDKIARYASAFGNLVILVVGLPLLLFCLWKVVQMARVIRLLRPLHITPERLKERIDSGEKIGVVDLLCFEGDARGLGAIPGAVRIDPGEMHRPKQVLMPDGVDLVLYCSSGNRLLSARVAAKMQKMGVRQIRVLQGGLASWTACGFPLSDDLADSGAELERLGIATFTPPLRPHWETARFRWRH